VIPWELKYDNAMRGWAGSHRGYLYATREKYGPGTALELFVRAQKIGDRVKIFTDTILTIFNLKGNDCETIGESLDIWDELTGTEATVLKRNKIINRRKVTKCPLETGYEDVSDWSLSFFSIMGKTVNPKVTLERPKGKCAGDSYCEYSWKLEENIPIEGTVTNTAKKLEIPRELKYNFAMRGWTSNHKNWLYALREKFGAAAAVDIYERFNEMGARIKNWTNTIRTIFKLEGNDCETIGKCWELWHMLGGQEFTVLERSKTIDRQRITKCPWKTEYKNISEWCNRFNPVIGRTINPKATWEMYSCMCAGDPYCEAVVKIEE
jgi:hypothetical protein